MQNTSLRTVSRGRMAATAFFGLVLLGTMITPASASTDWTPQTTGVSTTLFDVAFLPGTPTGVAVGAGGKILSTSDGGSNWIARTSDTTNDLRSVTALPVGCGLAGDQPCYWVGGAGGTMLLSQNGGDTWCSQPTGTTEQTQQSDHRGPDVVAVGNKGTILRSVSTSTRSCDVAGSYDRARLGYDQQSVRHQVRQQRLPRRRGCRRHDPPEDRCRVRTHDVGHDGRPLRHRRQLRQAPASRSPTTSSAPGA